MTPPMARHLQLRRLHGFFELSATSDAEHVMIRLSNLEAFDVARDLLYRLAETEHGRALLSTSHNLGKLIEISITDAESLGIAREILSRLAATEDGRRLLSADLIDALGRLPK